MDSSSNIVSNEVQIPRFVYFCDIHVMEDPGKFLFVALFSLVHRLSFSSSFLQGHKMIYRCMSDFLIPAPSLETSLQTLLRATDHTWKALSDILVTWITQKLAFIAVGNAKWYKPRWKIVWCFLTELMISLCDPAIIVLGICQKELKTYVADLYLPQNLHMDIFNSFVYNC